DLHSFPTRRSSDLQHRLISIRLQPTPVGNEHRHFRAVLACGEGLDRLIGVTIKLHLRCLENAALACGHIQTMNGWRVGEARERVKRFCVAAFAAESAGRSKTGELQPPPEHSTMT